MLRFVHNKIWYYFGIIIIILVLLNIIKMIYDHNKIYEYYFEYSFGSIFEKISFKNIKHFMSFFIQ